MKLELEVNSKHVDTSHIKGTGIVITPVMDENYWLYRVKLSDKQSILGFGKFGVVGVGFAEEVDGNINLPSGTDAEDIYEHISHNKGDKNICKENCIKAIRMIQKAVHETLKKKTMDRLKEPGISDVDRLAILSIYLRRTNSFEVAHMYDQREDIRRSFYRIDNS